MGEILAGEATPAQIAGFAVALRAKGETVEEVTGLADAMYAAADPISVPGRLLDVVGTGGDRSMSVNISTMAAIVAAGAGATRGQARQPVGVVAVRLRRRARGARHPARPAAGPGRRARRRGRHHLLLRRRRSTPRCGTPPCPRRELGIGTTFNFLGPLANPTRPAAQAIGCADPRMAPVMAGVFAGRGVDAWVFRGDDGLDELTTTTTSSVWTVHDGAVATATVDPAALGLAPATTEDLRGGDAAHNAEVVRRLLDGETGPVRDAVLLNAGAALAVHDAAGATSATRSAAASSGPREAVDSGRRQGDRSTAGSPRPSGLELQHVRRALAPEAVRRAGRSTARPCPAG